MQIIDPAQDYELETQEQDCPKSDKEWCVNEADDEESCIYVNLNENREQYTAFNGTPVWKAIYEENCMLDKINNYGINS